MTDFDALLAQARLPERTVEVCLRGDLVAEFEQLDRLLAAEQDKPGGGKLTDGARALELATRMEQLRGEMSDASATFTLRALPRARWAELVAKYPPKDASVYAFDAPAMATELVRASVIDPVVSDEQWQRLDELLSDAQFAELADAALLLNRRAVDIPFSLAASRTLQTSEPTSRRRPDSE